MGHSDKAHGKQGLRRRRGGPVPPGLVSRRGLCRAGAGVRPGPGVWGRADGGAQKPQGTGEPREARGLTSRKRKFCGK